jgi:hypothetical protein
MRISQTLAQLPALQARAKIPPHKRRSQWVNSIVGAVVFLGGLLAPWKLGFPWQAGLGLAAFGAFIVSKQLVLDFLKAVPQAISAIVGALGGKTP